MFDPGEGRGRKGGGGSLPYLFLTERCCWIGYGFQCFLCWTAYEISLSAGWSQTDGLNSQRFFTFQNIQSWCQLNCNRSDYCIDILWLLTRSPIEAFCLNLTSPSNNVDILHITGYIFLMVQVGKICSNIWDISSLVIIVFILWWPLRFTV